MKLKINIKARLQRHSRNRSSHSNKKSAFALLKKFKIIALIVILILPIYPSFGAFGANQETAVGNYDETTIITAYDDSQDTSLFSKDSGFIKPNNTLDDTRDVSGVNKLLTYTVTQGDSLSSISDKFNVSVSSIVWANDLNRSAALKSGMVIKIPPVSWVVYTVQAGDTIAAVASKFKIQSEKIQDQNKLGPKQELLIGQQLIIPGASKIEPPKAVAKVTPKNTGLSVKKPSQSYAVQYTGKGNRFAWGNCTYYVANHKNVTWRGNANQWLKNAAAAGVSTGSAPAAGAIIAFAGRGYNPYYGHVGIVAEIDGDELIIKDMNYRKLNEVTIRRISKNDPSIKGYIYTD